jgi:hypothetical protein
MAILCTVFSRLYFRPNLGEALSPFRVLPLVIGWRPGVLVGSQRRPPYGTPIIAVDIAGKCFALGGHRAV